MAEQLALYRLEPVAEPEDPRWQGTRDPATLIVRARSPGDARLVAAESERDFLETDAKPSHGASTRFASLFFDDKLYSVHEVRSSPHPREGPRGVVEGAEGPLPRQRIPGHR